MDIILLSNFLMALNRQKSGSWTREGVKGLMMQSDIKTEFVS